MPTPVLMVVCCVCEGVKVPPLELTIEDAGVLAQTHSQRDASRPLVTKEDLLEWYGHRLWRCVLGGWVERWVWRSATG